MSKELKITQGPYGFFIRYKGGGVTPTMLKGHFTSLQIAQHALDTYLSTKPTKKKLNANTDSKRREK
jgi:hypothetical protein